MKLLVELIKKIKTSLSTTTRTSSIKTGTSFMLMKIRKNQPKVK